MLEIVDSPMPTAPTRAYAMKAREDQDASKVIAGIFSLYDIEMHALIDLGSTHSYICTEHVFDRMPSVEQLPYDMLVTSPLGHNVKVNRVYKNCCDAPFPGGPLTTHQPAEYKWILGYPTPLQKIRQSRLCTRSSTQIHHLHKPVPINHPITNGLLGLKTNTNHTISKTNISHNIFQLYP